MTALDSDVVLDPTITLVEPPALVEEPVPTEARPPRSGKKPRKPRRPRPGDDRPRVLVAATGVSDTDSLAAALDGPADYVTVEVRSTGDGALVVAADTVEAMGRTARLADHSLAAIELMTGNRLLRLLDALALVRDGGKKAHLSLRLGYPSGAYDAPEDTVEADVVRIAHDVLGAGGFLVSAIDDVSVAAVRGWADRSGLTVQVGLDLGASRGNVAARLRQTGATVLVVDAARASRRVLAAARTAQVPVLIDRVAGRRDLVRFMADERVWMVASSDPSQAPRHRAPRPVGPRPSRVAALVLAAPVAPLLAVLAEIRL